MSQLPSRTPDISINDCVENIGGRMEMILIAAQRARDLRDKHMKSNDDKHKNFATEALLEIQDGKIKSDYLTSRLIDE